jgi:Protein of unknown function (DUF3987)
MIAADPRGILLFRDELSGWFQSFNQYRPGADEQFYLQCHAGGPWLQNRMSGDIIIPDIYLNIFGGFQPKIIKSVLAGKSKSCDNGMTARFSLLVWPDTAKEFSFIDSASTPHNRSNVDTIFKHLAEYDPEQFVGPKIEQSYPPFRFDDAGYDIFREWYVRVSLLIRSNEDDEDPYFNHLSKYPGLFARLALVHHLLRYAAGGPSKPDPATVDAETATAVRDLIDDYLTPHPRKIYGRLNRSSGYAGAVRIARWMVTDKTDNPTPDKTAKTSKPNFTHWRPSH